MVATHCRIHGCWMCNSWSCLQEVLQHVSWPVDVLEAYAALPVRQTLSNAGGTSINSNSGVGDRPRLKMGLAEGVPGEIAPDHLVSEHIPTASQLQQSHDKALQQSIQNCWRG